MMTRMPIVSRAFAALRYDPGTLTLEVEYRPRKDGAVVVDAYQPVAAEIVAAMMEAEASAGSILYYRVRTDPDVHLIRHDEHERVVPDDHDPTSVRAVMKNLSGKFYSVLTPMPQPTEKH